MDSNRFDLVVVGGGPAGLCLSYHLSQRGRSHVVLEQGRIAEAWRSKRWDSLRVIGPNWHIQFAGRPYAGSDAEGFMHRDDVVARIEEYARSFDAPVRCGVRVAAIDADEAGGFLVGTSAGRFQAAQVVIATGANQHPRIPACSEDLPDTLFQLPSCHYRNPDELPAGAVLVVGGGPSGCQIAEELRRAGRTVFLSVGSNGWAPRRYRGRDSLWWAVQIGLYDQLVNEMPEVAKRGVGSPVTTGLRGGCDLNLHTLARDGVILLGHLEGTQDGTLRLSADLRQRIERSDAHAHHFYQAVDAYIEAHGLAAPKELPARYTQAYDTLPSEAQVELNLRDAGITTLVWATGYRPRFGWVHLPVFDGDGYPVHRRGVTAWPGLYFLGLDWLHKRQSSLILGLPEDAAHLAAAVCAGVVSFKRPLT